MQNDFLQRSILPKCFTTDASRISMETQAKENFRLQRENRTTVTFIQFYYTLSKANIQQKKQNFLSEKQKVPKTFFKVFRAFAKFVMTRYNFLFSLVQKTISGISGQPPMQSSFLLQSGQAKRILLRKRSKGALFHASVMSISRRETSYRLSLSKLHGTIVISEPM